MRVVEWEEFARLPAGTLYSKREAQMCGDGWPLFKGLYVKGDMASDVDHWEGELFPQTVDVGDVINAGADFNLAQGRSSCEGVFRHHYAIFERDDLLKLAAVVEGALLAL